MTIHLWEIWSHYKYDFKRLSYWPSEVSVCFNLDPKTLCFWQITNLSNFPDVRTSNRVFSNHNVFIYTGRWLPSGCGVKILLLDRWVFDSCHRQKSWLSFFRNSFRIPQIFLSFLGPTRRRCDSIVRSLRSLNYSIFQKRNIRLNAIIHKLETAAYLIICLRFVPDFLWLFCNKDLRYENSFVYT